ncbi:MAG: HAMP domain-containing histidine kinase [Eubacterium sp.]|nr:HAMP domain-containing histidine kinase [Eubacterium sp.]
MKNKNNKNIKNNAKPKSGFRQLRTKIACQTAGMLVMAAVFVYSGYSFLLRGNFASRVQSVFQTVFGMDEAAAAKLYGRTFRSHMDILIVLSLLAVFAVLLHIYLGWFSRYFEEISKGLDALFTDTPAEISLSPELLRIERKLNLAKHTIGRQKNEMLLSEQRKNDLIMYLAHDLKTPLSTALSYLHLLRDEPTLNRQLQEKYLSICLSKAQRLECLINEFLEIAKYNLSHIALQYSEIDLARLLEQLVYEFTPILEKKGLSCRIEAADCLPFTCDADKMMRVFDNLLQNAVIYSFDHTEITITAKYCENVLILEFANHGSTIPEEKLAHIFEQFYRLDPERSTAGTGLGLAVAKQIIALHKGTVCASSKDGLTVFTVRLPEQKEIISGSNRIVNQ